MGSVRYQHTAPKFSQVVWLGLSALFMLASVRAQTPSFVFFDAPDAGHGFLQGTSPVGISQDGTIAGVYVDASDVPHGFVRLANGQITEFDLPGKLTQIEVVGTNARGQIVGSARTGFGTRNERYHGWLRNRNGIFTGIDVPGATATVVHGINDNGEIVGEFDSGHGFLRDANGNYTTLDGPSADSTIPQAINGNGQVTGYLYTGAVPVGFVRDADGTWTTFDVPNNTHKPDEGPYPHAINLAGEVAGFCYDDNGQHAFVRDPSGVLTLFEMPNAIETDPAAINDQGVVGGHVIVKGTRGQLFGPGFLRDSLGDLRFLSLPIPNTGSLVLGINDRGTMTGMYFDAAQAIHGFVK